MKQSFIIKMLYIMAVTAFLFPKICSAQGKEALPEDHPKRIIGYFASWGQSSRLKGNYGVDDIPWDKLTHINYAFATVGSHYGIELLDSAVAIQEEYPGQDGQLSFKGQFNLINVYKEQYPDVKVLISIGGWAASGGFYEMLDTQENRETFAQSCVDFLREYNFDGIDIDFEYPTSAEGAVYPLDDQLWWQDRKDVIYENYVEMIKTLREYLDNASQEDSDSYLLTAAVSASAWTLSGMQVSRYCSYLDYLNIMTYDLHGAWNNVVGPQSALYATDSDPETQVLDQPTLNVDWAVKYYSGIMHPDRINIGIPYYSRGWTEVTGGTNGLWGTSPKVNHTFEYEYEGETYTHTQEMGKGAEGIHGIWNDPAPEAPAGANPLWHVFNLLENPGTAVYDYLSETDIAGEHTGLNGYARYFDDETLTPWLWHSGNQVFLTYEDTASLQHKLDYILDRDLGGMMFWELSGDYQYDSQMGYYVPGSAMTTFAYDYFNNNKPVPQADIPSLLEDTLDFSYDFSVSISHPNVTPTFTITNNTGEEIPAGWELEFYLPKSGRWDATWGTGELSVVDDTHPFWTKYRITGPSWNGIQAGESVEISGTVKLYFSNGPRHVTLNGSISPDEQLLEPSLDGVVSASRFPESDYSSKNIVPSMKSTGNSLRITGVKESGMNLRLYDLLGRASGKRVLQQGENEIKIKNNGSKIYLYMMDKNGEKKGSGKSLFYYMR